ncbi:MAG: ABC-type multidrug transport system, ATPase and permease component [Bacillales bacterium]|jgi:ATP-binding cassette subfamily B protein|nr:ABC-type multidrug transport system, ATPase and permease component [Bacillales bacterium]
MLKLTKFAKPFLFGIIVIFVLLFVQAMTDLALPDYTSKIVNNGIQQGGIENASPAAIRVSEMELLKLFMTDVQKNEVMKSYKLLDKNKLTSNDYNEYKKDYPVLTKEPIYILKNVSDVSIKKLNKIFREKMMIVSGIKMKGVPTPSWYSNSSKTLKGDEAINVIISLAKQAPDQITKIQEQASAQIKELPNSLLDQSAIKFVKEEYKAIGMDTDSLQNAYMWKIGFLMLAVTFIGGVCAIAVSYISARVGAGFARDLRAKVFTKVESFSNTEFDKFSTASLITRTTNDVQQIQMLMIMLLRIVFYAPIMAIGGIYKVVTNDASMSWITALAIGALFALIAFMFTVAMPKFKIVQKLVDKINLVTREGLSGMMVIRAFNTQQHEEERFDEANKNLTRTNLFVNRVMSAMWPIMMLIMNGSSLLIIWVGSHHVDKGTMQVGNLMAFMQYTIQIIFSFLMVSIVFIMVPRASVSAKRISEVLDVEPVITDPDNPVSLDKMQTGKVVFNNVSFKYPNAEDYALKNINFTAEPGKTTAIIGSTGSGKTTLINLIPRFYDVTDGELLIEGVDVRKVTQKALRNLIGYVPQKAVLFSGTIESNLQFAKEGATEIDMKTAASIAQAEKFISEKEEGFKSNISQGGTNVSGGQKQRLSIARALMKKAPIYIFDDSFSALDFKTDSSLRKALHKEVQNATILLVAQRVSTIMNADQIIVLEDGKIAGIGTHHELLDNCAVYQDIASSQLSKEELSHE